MDKHEWYIYIVECDDHSFYTGIAKDVAARVKKHNSKSGGSKYCRGRQPVKLVFQHGPVSQSQAMRIERKVKKFSRAEKEVLIFTKGNPDTVLVDWGSKRMVKEINLARKGKS